MDELTLSIGGLTTALRCENPALQHQMARRYAPFQVDDLAPHMRIAIHEIDAPPHPAPPHPEFVFEGDRVTFEQPGYQGAIRLLEGEAALFLGTTHPFEGAEYFIRVAYALLAFRAGGLLFHGAGVVREGQGYIFFGHSGAGKTTICRLSPDGVVLNDDLLVLLPGETGWTVHATPFTNPTQVPPTHQSAPLVALLRLVQSQEVKLEPMGRAQALAELVSNAPVISSNPAYSAKLMTRCLKLQKTVPSQYLHFRKEPSFWDVMKGR